MRARWMHGVTQLWVPPWRPIGARCVPTSLLRGALSLMTHPDPEELQAELEELIMRAHVVQDLIKQVRHEEPRSARERAASRGWRMYRSGSRRWPPDGLDREASQR